MPALALRRDLAALLASFVLASCGGGGDGGGGGPLNITSTAADDGVVGAPYNNAVAATGGKGSKSFSITGGALPDGLTMSASGVISGTPAGPVGTSSFTVQVTDSAKTPATDTQALSIDIVLPLDIESVALPDTSVGEDYAGSIVAAEGTPPYAFSVSEGELPAGLSIGADGGVTGTVLPSATTETFTIEVSDSTSPPQTFPYTDKVIVTLEITTGSLADATGGVEYADSIGVRGGLPPYAFELTGGALPDGLEGPDPTDGTISGTPEPACTASNAVLTVQVTDDDTPAQSDTRAGIDLTVNPATLDITTSAMANARLDTAYDQRIVASGGVPPYSFAITSGSLPNQLSLNAGTGSITGTPDTLETRAFEVTVTDSCPDTAEQALSITVDAASLGRNNSISTATVLPGNGTYSASISPSGHPNSTYEPDEDFYSITTTAASTITLDINAQVNGSPIDAVVEVLNAAGTQLQTCGTSPFDDPCFNDDDPGGGTLDSYLQLRVSGATIVYIRVVEFGSIARPDMLYDLVISGVQ
jgi:hypothetical protein